MLKPAEYKHIAAWGHVMGSYANYIEHQQELASRSMLPIDALFQRSQGDTKSWVFFSQTDLNPECRKRVEHALARLS